MYSGDHRVRYACQQVTVTVEPDAAALAEPVLTFVQPHFEVVASTDAHAESSVHLTFRHRDRFQAPADEGEQTLVRRRTPGKHVFGRRWRRDGWTVLSVGSSGTAFELADDGSAARVYLGDRSRYHASDLLRDVMWELALPTGRFLHAAAVCGPDGVVAFTGPKGAGKTTTSIDFLYAGASFYTGDVLFLGADGMVHGFPDYPHLGWGTLRAFPALYDAAVAEGAEPADDAVKVLLAHDIYRTALGAEQAGPPQRLKAVVAPDVSTEGAPRLRPAPPMAHLLEPMDRQTSDPGEGWEPFLAQVGLRSAGRCRDVETPDVAWFTRAGRGPLPPEDVTTVLGPGRPGHETTDMDAAAAGSAPERTLQ